jgi:hypothetical protein
VLGKHASIIRQNGLVGNSLRPGYAIKKGEGALPHLFFCLKGRQTFPLFYADRLVLALSPAGRDGFGWNKAIYSSLVPEIFFTIVEITLHAFVQFVGHGTLPGAVAECPGNTGAGIAAPGKGRARSQLSNLGSALLSAALGVFPAIHVVFLLLKIGDIVPFFRCRGECRRNLFYDAKKTM